jgi:resuscitation-promoting factor RpfA
MDQKSPEAFRTISEVAEWLGVPTHVLRFWESRFSQVKPVKRAGGRRYYRPADMELLGGIRKLLHEDGMTIRGVQKLLREKGVRHVAEMAPPLDLAADTKNTTPDNVVDLSDRRETGAETGEPQGDEPEAEDANAPWYDSGIFAQSPGARPAPEDTAAADVREPDHEPPTAEAASETPSAEAPGDADAPADPGDPLPDPEMMDFLAHDATPEVFEPEGPEARAAEPAAPSEAEPGETDPADPMSSPDALDFAAHDALPDTHEPQADADEAEAQPEIAAEEPAPEAPAGEPEAAAPQAPEPAAPAEETAAPPEPAPRPALVMPEIAPDPDDTVSTPQTQPMSTRLRELRGSRAGISVANLRALADRLDEIADRMHASTSPTNRF